ncbi:jg4091 [Pararge aegeria aegeria]|uniref:Jg4091 protein n=1 Tax=Pararge aegeria aegeria TaxID=348720 RepID=A0A8S4RRK2_9NEOP|nr:jg4091 [Pararge aegeria aegeria]
MYVLSAGEGAPGGERGRCAGAVSRGMRRRPLLLLLLALLRTHGLLAASGETALSTEHLYRTAAEALQFSALRYTGHLFD